MATSFSKKRIAVIIALVAIGVGVFLSILEGVRESSDLARLDIPTLNWVVTHRSPFMTTLMQLITDIMAPVTLAVIVFGCAALWSWHRREVWRPVLLVGSMGFALATSTILKGIIERSRPPLIDMVPPYELDFSFPSGHTLGIAVCLLVISYFVLMKRPSKQMFAKWSAITISGIAIVAFSRLYLGYHWVTDVSASVGVALVILGLAIIVDTIKPQILTLLRLTKVR
jgi:undecaprenyl-diphosphatase